MTMVSFVVANYNYAQYLPACLDSALAQDWPEIEVIVVDDGSRDDSRAVIEGYGDRITAIFQENGGQRVANNTGFAASKGDIIVFLDADDTVEPDFASSVVKVWGPNVSKVQVQLIHMDSEGKRYGAPFPAWDPVPTPADIRRWTLTSSEYPTPPGTGNAYARTFLEKIFPVGPERDSFTDSTTLPLAPLMGDVVSIARPLVYYRRHGSNDSNLTTNPALFAREVARAMQRQETTTLFADRAGVTAPPADVLRRSWYVLQLRVASLRMAPAGHPLPGDGRVPAMVDAVRNLVLPGSEPMKRRLKLSAWSLATLAAPAPLARKLVQRRFGA